MLKLKYKFPLTEKEILSIRDQVRSECAVLGLETTLMATLVSLADELSCNIMKYSGAHWMELGLEQSDGRQPRTILTLRDDGIAFDPIEAAGYFDEPVVAQGLDGHLGLWMMRPLIPELKYSRLDGQINQLVFTRNLDKGAKNAN